MNTASLPAPVQALLFATLGAITTGAAMAAWQTAANAEQPVLWWAGRASGFVAYIALWLSLLFGTLVSSKGAGGLLPRKTLMDLHEQWTLSAVVASVLHVLTLVFHSESGVTPWAAVVPFASARLTGPVALGTVAFLGLGVIAVSSWLRRRLSYTVWRAVHGMALGVMVLTLVHSITAGTDAGAAPARWLYLVTAAVLAGAVVMRVLSAIGDRRARARARVDRAASAQPRTRRLDVPKAAEAAGADAALGQSAERIPSSVPELDRREATGRAWLRRAGPTPTT